ncbi:methyltransferase protein [Orbilia oligospora]|uniref:Protein arginine N-methyltransferase n=1 Tax=Orbilia oligospora TaxID=2813651 RepID=A0A6G1MNM4_ORBOL|nr:methyltransferase protein [Orbilia oligospora]KAF3219944.1 methyltransferase protein [Orbilia oligospora]KAF3264314.1 methyltransferase protein [Orbilia oligospora]
MAFFIGEHLPAPGSALSFDLLDRAVQDSYNMISVHISNINYRSKVEAIIEEARSQGSTRVYIPGLEVEDVNMHPDELVASGKVIGVTSQWIELDSLDPLVASASRQVLHHEIGYAGFCGLATLLIDGPKTAQQNMAGYCQSIVQGLAINAYLTINIMLPAFGPSLAPKQGEVDDPSQDSDRVPPDVLYDELTSWDIWNTIRTSARYTSRLGLGLQIEYSLPRTYTLKRWKYLHYHIINLPPPPPLDSFGAGYQDYLQSPLQPLADNLESMTYEVFEKDPVKYAQYEKAVFLALQDLNQQGIEDICVAVVGAGRGPLVTRCLRAATNASIDITMFAIEKNPNAYTHLMKMNRDVWGGAVTLVKTDMRKWEPPNTYVHILVSELLGSFADNELSPECLDGVQRVLHPTVGINIPQSYTAHYTPIMAPKIHGDLLSRATSSNSVDIYEVPYVVMLTAIDFLSQNNNGEPNIHQAWEFKHPVPENELEHDCGFNDHNQREAIAAFPIPRRGVIHGIAGYFECILYENANGTAIVELSTRPDTIDAKSKDMISWFAIYFPLRTPMPVPDDSEAQVSFWRHTDGRKVWYDWMVETFSFVFLSAEGGITSSPMTVSSQKSPGDYARKRVPVAVSEICSSKKNGCLM